MIAYIAHFFKDFLIKLYIMFLVWAFFLEINYLLYSKDALNGSKVAECYKIFLINKNTTFPQK